MCLCLTGLVGTQSHWELVALGAGRSLSRPAAGCRRSGRSPWGSWPGWPWPRRTMAHPSWLAGGAVLAAVWCHVRWRAEAEAGTCTGSGLAGRPERAGVAGFAVVVTLLTLFGRGPPQPTDQAQTLAWSASPMPGAPRS